MVGLNIDTKPNDKMLFRMQFKTPILVFGGEKLSPVIHLTQRQPTKIKIG